MTLTRTTRALLLALTLGAPVLPGNTGAPLHAQQVERQRPLDPDREVLEIDAGLRRDLGLFPGVRDFRYARLFEAEDGTFVLEITTGPDGALVRERRPVTLAELAALRTEIGQALALRGQDRLFRQDGRTGLVLGVTTLGLGFYGWGIPEAFDIESDRGVLATYLITSGLSFLVPYLITDNATVTVPMRNAAFWGGTRGILHGVLIGDMLAGSGGNADDDDDAQIGAGIVASVVETWLGAHLARSWNLDEGDVGLVTTVADYGLAYGFALPYVAGLFTEEVCIPDIPCQDQSRLRPAGDAAALALSVGSVFAARAWAGAEDYTLGDSRALRSFGLLGAQAVAPIAHAILDTDEAGETEERIMVATLVAGSAAALWAGNRVLREASLTGGAGWLVLAGHVAGGAGALGITYLIDDGNSDEVLYLTTSAVGSILGSIATFQAVRGGRPEPRGGAGGAGGASPRDRGPTIRFEPGALLLAGQALAGVAPDRPASAPLLSIRF